MDEVGEGEGGVKIEHSPTPWRVDDDTHIQDASGEYILSELEMPDERGETYTAEDAAFIVKAVNCHDELVKELQDMYDFIIDRGYSDEESDGMIGAKLVLTKAKS